MLTFTKEKNPSEFLVEQRAKSNEQRGKSNEQRAKSFYLVTFKVRKFDSLFYKLNACLQRTTTCIGLQAEQIFSIYVFRFGRGICGSFSMLFPEAPATCDTEILK